MISYKRGPPIDHAIIGHLFGSFPTDSLTADDWKQVCAFLLVNIRENNPGLWEGLGILEYNAFWKTDTLRGA